MIFLSNSELRVTVLDPREDRPRLGPRFCTGCYVYQIEDRTRGPLLSGPEYPEAEPSVLNGQGMPDVFQFTLYQSPDEIPEKKLIIGVGIVENSAGRKAGESHFQSAVEEFADWDVEESPSGLLMRTKQRYGQWHFTLTRRLELDARGLLSHTLLHNHGPAPLPFRWFAHPFFPPTADGRCAILRPGSTVTENPGFRVNPEGLVTRKESSAWESGHYQLVTLPPPGLPFAARCFHPLARLIELSCDFIPSKVALWANDRTFSCEPFHEALIAPDDYHEWSLTLTVRGGAE